ncbi:MAG: hypothetical protein SWZ49_27155 [Cyanobacteriota bacterium]|nr:hypothetical protein [Cyanobacteriota bacterium]
MSIESLVGTWQLIGSASTKGELAFIDNKPDPNGVKNWLKGEAGEIINQINSTSGLTLTINQNGTFTEEKEGNPEVNWFSSEGVLESKVVSFNGKVKFQADVAYLYPNEIPDWAKPRGRKYGIVLRYNDGDTIISDNISLIDEKLVRTVNVVTDGMYFDRVVIVYEKS